MNGTVLAGTNNVFEVECEDGIIRNCTIKGKVLKSEKEYYNPLAPGDIVEIEPDEIDKNNGQVVSLVPRKNEFVRWNVKGRKDVLAELELKSRREDGPQAPDFAYKVFVYRTGSKKDGCLGGA